MLNRVRAKHDFNLFWTITLIYIHAINAIFGPLYIHAIMSVFILYVSVVSIFVCTAVFKNTRAVLGDNLQDTDIDDMSSCYLIRIIKRVEQRI